MVLHPLVSRLDAYALAILVVGTVHNFGVVVEVVRESVPPRGSSVDASPRPRDVDSPWRRNAVAATWIFRGARRRRGRVARIFFRGGDARPRRGRSVRS